MCTHTAPLDVIGNHLYANVSPGPWLLDTGSPGSFSAQLRGLPIREIIHPMPSHYRNVTMMHLREIAGIKAEGLIGNDILSQHFVALHLSGRRDHGWINFADKPLQPISGAQRLTLSMETGVPIVEARMEGRENAPFVFDTGAQFSYVADPRWLQGEPIGRFTDFMPLHGKFEVDVHLATIRLGSITAQLRFTHHPAVTRKLKSAQADGIIGWEILRHGPALYYAGVREMWI